MPCFNFGATGASMKTAGTIYIGSVSDDPYDLRTRVVIRRPPGGLAFAGTDLEPLSKDSSFFDPAYPDSVALLVSGPTRGVNEAGLSFSYNLAAEKPENRAAPDALPGAAFWARIMAECRTVEEAIPLMESLPRAFSGACILADRIGDIAIVEAGRKRLLVTDRKTAGAGGFAVNVNCWMVMQDQEGDPICSIANPMVPNKSRFERANKLLAEADGQIDLQTMRMVLSDHANRERYAGENPWIPGHGYSICNHGNFGRESLDRQQPGWGSVSGEIMDPVEAIFWYAYGWPCGEQPSHSEQLLQQHSWGTFVGFPVADLPAGEYTTITGQLTPLALKHFPQLHAWPSADAAPRTRQGDRQQIRSGVAAAAV